MVQQADSEQAGPLLEVRRSHGGLGENEWRGRGKWQRLTDRPLPAICMLCRAALVIRL